MEQEQIKTSIFPNDEVQMSKLGKEQLALPTWGLLVVLVVVFFVLKTFIYLKDPKRHNK